MIPKQLKKYVWKYYTFIQTYQSLLEEEFRLLEVPDLYLLLKVMVILEKWAFKAAEIAYPDTDKNTLNYGGHKSWQKQRKSYHIILKIGRIWIFLKIMGSNIAGI